MASSTIVREGTVVKTIGDEVMARFERVWNRLAEVNSGVSEEELAVDIKAARQA